MSAATFAYRALDGAGKESRGAVQATTREQAFRKVSEMGLTPLSVRASKPKRKLLSSGKVRSADVLQFTYELQVLIEARIPISEGIAGLAAQEERAQFRAVLLDIAAEVESGRPISDSMEKHRQVFGDVYVETVAAAEKSGTMVRTLSHLCEALERLEASRRQVKGALLYPACVSAALVLGAGFLITYTVPKFATMFEARGVDLPFLTKVLAALGMSIQSYWWAYLLGIGVFVFGVRYLLNNRVGALETAFHKVPVFRPVLVGLAVARFSRVFSVSLSAGLGLLDAMEMAKRAASRKLLSDEIDSMVSEIRAGRQLADGLAVSTYMPSFARRMFVAGEQSGELGRMAEIVAKHYERESSHQIKSLTTLMEPVLVIAISSVVLVVALAIFLPMWNMIQLLG